MVVKIMLSAREFWALKFYSSSSFMGELLAPGKRHTI